MQRFELNKYYKNIVWDGRNYVQKGCVYLLSRTPQEVTNSRGFTYRRWPAIINNRRTWVDIDIDVKADCETLHELSSTGNWKKKTVRYRPYEVGVIA